MSRKIVFLDRDGTLIVDKVYLNDPEQIEFYPDTLPALKSLAMANWEFILVTNQSGVATGQVSERNLREIHRRMATRLGDFGLHFLDVLYAPYLNTSRHYYRKPRFGMLQEGLVVHKAPANNCWMIGDTEADVGAGVSAGMRTVRLVRGIAPISERIPGVFQSTSLIEAARIVLDN